MDKLRMHGIQKSLNSLIAKPAQRLTIILLAITDFSFANPPSQADLYTEFSLVFQNTREIGFKENRKENVIILTFKNTTPEELANFHNYDERLIRRLLIKDLSDRSEVYLYLLRDHLKATVDQYDEPFRVIVSIFDKDYVLPRSPETGIPVTLSFQASTHEEPLSESLSPVSTLSPSAQSSQTSQTSKTLKLLQPTFETQTKPTAQLTDIPEGKSKTWDIYPVYVYPILTTAYEGRSEELDWKKTPSKKASENEYVIAQNAYRMFTLGQEKKALHLYTKILHSTPQIFDTDPLHLWTLAELNLGEENLVLADSYYDQIPQKFPDSPLAHLSKIRRFDVKALQKLKDSRLDDLPMLAEQIGAVKSESIEITLHKMIRKAFWKAKFDITQSRQDLPTVDESDLRDLINFSKKAESKKTRFIAEGIILKTLLSPARPWSVQTGSFAGQFFDNYTTEDSARYRKILKAELTQKLSQQLIQLSAENRFVEAIETFEKLPPVFKDIKNDPDVSWAVGEAYRNLEQLQLAQPFYGIAQKSYNSGVKRLRALFWYGVTSASVIETLGESDIEVIKAKTLSREIQNADHAMSTEWERLADADKDQIQTSYKAHFEATLNPDAQLALRTPAKIILLSWTQALATKMDIDSTQKKQNTHFDPTAETVYLLQSLAKRFRELGMNTQRRESIHLMQKIKPDRLMKDKEASKVWAEELLALADEYRSENEFLQAGELYTFTANEAPNWEKKGEALYKGGLLLYRAGKRSEAIEALTKASQDGNNLFYANLAKERLIQLKPQ